MRYQIPETHVETRKSEARELQEKYIKTAPIDKLKKRWQNLLKKNHAEEQKKG